MTSSGVRSGRCFDDVGGLGIVGEHLEDFADLWGPGLEGAAVAADGNI